MAQEIYNSILDVKKVGAKNQIAKIVSDCIHSPEGTFSVIANLFLISIGSEKKLKVKEEFDLKSFSKEIKSEFKYLIESKTPLKNVPDVLVYAPSKRFFKIGSPQFLEFWVKLGGSFSSSLETKDFGQIIEFLCDFSSSKIRHVRLVSTQCAYSLITGLITSYKNAAKNKKIAKTRLATKKNKDKAREDLSEVKKSKKAIKNKIDILFERVFTKRYRDVCEDIRGDAIHQLGKWVNLSQKLFLTDERLKYIGWLLSDSSAGVRRSCLMALVSMYSKKKNTKALAGFSERFFDRMTEMLQDRARIVNVWAIKLVIVFSKMEMLEDSDDDAMLKLLFHKYMNVRDTATKFYIYETFNAITDDAKTLKALADLHLKSKDVGMEDRKRAFYLVHNFFKILNIFKDWPSIFEIMKKLIPKEAEENSNESQENSAGFSDEETCAALQILAEVPGFESAMEIDKVQKSRDIKKTKKILEDYEKRIFGDYSLEAYEICSKLLETFRLDDDKLVAILKLYDYLDYEQIGCSDHSLTTNRTKNALMAILNASKSENVFDRVSRALEKMGKSKNQLSKVFKDFIDELDLKMMGDLSDEIENFDFSLLTDETPSEDKIVELREKFEMKCTKLKSFMKFNECYSPDLISYLIEFSNKLKPILVKILKDRDQKINKPVKGKRKRKDSSTQNQTKANNKIRDNVELILKSSLECIYMSHLHSLNYEAQKSNGENENYFHNEKAQKKSIEPSKYDLANFLTEIFALPSLRVKLTVFRMFCDLAFVDEETLEIADKFKQSAIEFFRENVMERNSAAEKFDNEKDFEAIIVGSGKLAVVDPKYFRVIVEGLLVTFGTHKKENDELVRFSLEKVYGRDKTFFFDRLFDQLKPELLNAGEESKFGVLCKKYSKLKFYAKEFPFDLVNRLNDFILNEKNTNVKFLMDTLCFVRNIEKEQKVDMKAKLTELANKLKSEEVEKKKVVEEYIKKMRVSNK